VPYGLHPPSGLIHEYQAQLAAMIGIPRWKTWSDDGSFLSVDHIWRIIQPSLSNLPTTARRPPNESGNRHSVGPRVLECLAQGILHWMHLAAWETVRNTVPVANVPNGHVVVWEDEVRPACRSGSVETPVTAAPCPPHELPTN